VKSRDELAATVAHMFRLDEDLSGFYAVVSADGDLSWCATGAGRMLRAPTVFEDVIKTTCTFIRMFGAKWPDHYARGRSSRCPSPEIGAWRRFEA
jgi:hypothetical protein